MGGAINEKNVLVKSTESKPLVVNKSVEKGVQEVLQRVSQDDTVSTMQLQQLRDGLYDMRNPHMTPYYIHRPWFESHDERKLYRGVLPLFSGHGAHKDHHKLHKFMIDSFTDYPEILQLYTRSGSRQKVV